MKKNHTIQKIILFLFGISYCLVFAQSAPTGTNSNNINDSGLRLSVRAGYDVPAFGNNTPYIDYKGGLEAGASLDYYWHWLGIGADFDYINNKPKNTYPTSNLILGGMPVSNFSLSEDNITRMFYGIGPSFKYQKNNKSFWEFKLRAGLSSIKGGRTELLGNTSSVPTLLNFHAGYDLKNAFAGKASLQYNRYISPNFGFLVGAYYLQHFKGNDLVDPKYGISATYLTFTNDKDVNIINTQNASMVRDNSCNCEIHSVGAYAGLFFTFGGKKKEAACPVCGKVHYPFCCATCGCDVTITARDKFTKELLENTDVVLADESGNISQSGTTNSYGAVVFKNVLPGNYTVKGKLHDVELAQNNITNNEFNQCKTEGKPIQKEILYTNENFIIKGKVVVCNTNTAINGVQVVLKNNQLAVQKSTNTEAKGEFIFQALQNANYSIYGKKANYLSQTATVSTQDYDRTKTLFIKLEICLDPADCGKAIVLKNILYDLDKYFIRNDAKPELNRLVQFMQDNPDVKVELSSHTDSRASDNYNNTLSQNRANAAVDYIVSQGIARNRLVGKGYGETKLLNKCADNVPCTEAEHQINRRTEVKVLCPGGN